MPTILNLNGYRFFFFSMEGQEPPHIHIESGEKVCKFWIDPVRLAYSCRLKQHELNKIKIIVIEYRKYFLEKWYEHFSN